MSVRRVAWEQVELDLAYPVPRRVFAQHQHRSNVLYIVLY